MKIQMIATDMVYQGWGRYLVVTFLMPDGQKVGREIEDHGTAAGVLPYDAARRTAILVRQFRAPAYFATGQDETLEAVAGIVEDLGPAACVRREALEEAGLELGIIEHVVTAWTMPGVSTERIDLYLAPYRPADRIAAGGGIAAEHESTAVVEMALADLAVLADSGQLTDMKTLVLVQTLRLRRPDLFTNGG